MHNGKTSPLLALISFVLLFSLTNSSNLPTTPPQTKTHLQVAHSTCQGTLYPNLCVSTLSTFQDLASKSVPQIICSTLNSTINEVKSSSFNCTRLKKRPSLHPYDQRALDDCLNLFDNTIEELKSTINDLSQTKITSKPYHNCQTLLSGAMTNVYTCLDGFAYSKTNLRHKIEKKLYKISNHVSNSLALLMKVPGVKNKSSESEAFPEYGEVNGGFPSWITRKDRKLLQAAVSETHFNLVVAKDGTGNFSTIGEALAAAPNSSTTRQVLSYFLHQLLMVIYVDVFFFLQCCCYRFVIHIKEGAYFENVEVIKKKINLMLVGDGIGKTVVKASRNVIDGWTTFQSATFGQFYNFQIYYFYLFSTNVIDGISLLDLNANLLVLYSNYHKQDTNRLIFSSKPKRQ